jgi:predicted permease
MQNEPRWRRYLRFPRPEHPASASARTAWLSNVRQDVTYALRQLRRAPLFMAVATISIGLGVGLNVTIFSLANGLLLRPPPGVRADGLQRVYVNHHGAFQWQDFAWFRERATLLESMVGERLLPMSMETGDTPERIVGAFATRGFFQTLGVRMALGRAFYVDERETGEAVTVLSYATWRARFGGDSSVVGRAIRLGGRPFTIVGVAAPEFTSSVFPWSPALWVPLASSEALTGTRLDDFGGSLYTTARLRAPGHVGPVAAQLNVLAKQRFAMDTSRSQQFTVRLDHVRGVNAEMRTPAAMAVGFLLAMVLLVLVIACANVANLLLSRASARRTEIGVRLALGASQGRLMRQLLTESVILALLGAALGVTAALMLVKVVVSLLPLDSGVAIDFSPDRRVFSYAVLVCIGSAILFGLAPALRATSPSLTRLLRGDTDAGGSHSRMRGVLVGGQVALCVIVLATAALLARSFVLSRAVDPGIVAAGILDVQLDLGQRRAAADGLVLYDRIVERLAAIPGVTEVALADLAPLAGSNMEARVALDGVTTPDRSSLPKTYFNVVGHDYFATVRMRIVRGREFTRRDGPASPKVAVINETAARRWWPNTDPVGRRFRWGGADGDPIEVVGVARDAKYNSYGEDPTPFVYLAFAQNYRSQMVAHVRVATASVTPVMLQSAVRETDSALPPPTVKPLSEEIAFALVPARLGALLLGVFGLVALIIAASGIYGVTSYAVSRRTKEIGIRSALGASHSRLLGLIIGEGMRTVAIGAGIGLLLAVATGTLLSRVLYGISPIDPAMLVGVPAVLSCVALVACWVPARRAARVDPVTAMRAE